jgi:hypothetical protein
MKKQSNIDETQSITKTIFPLHPTPQNTKFDYSKYREETSIKLP